MLSTTEGCLTWDEISNTESKILLYTSMKFIKDNVKNKDDCNRMITEFNLLMNTYVKLLNEVVTLIKSKIDPTEHNTILLVIFNIETEQQTINYHRSKFQRNIRKVFTALKS